MNKYRVLIVDDRLNNLETARDVISSNYQLFDNTWKIEKEIAHIKVIECDGKYSIDKQSIINIATLSSQPFDLLLFDIAFYIEGGSNKVFEILNSIYEKGTYSFKRDLEKYVFNPNSLVAEGRKYLKKNNKNNLLDQFNKNFVGHKGKIYGYTFIEDRWKRIFYNLKQCKDILQDTFPNTDKPIEVEGTRQEIFNDNEEFAKLRNNKEGEKYYSFILAKYLEQLIKIEIAKKGIEDAKYITAKRTSKLIGSLVFLCALIGACSEFFGSLIIESFKDKQYLIALVCLCFTIFIVVLSGKFVLHFIENLMPKLFKDKTEDERF